MRKLKLETDELRVETFVASPEGAGRGTVRGHDQTGGAACYTVTRADPTCGGTQPTCAGGAQTCDDNCHSTLIGDCFCTDVASCRCEG